MFNFSNSSRAEILELARMDSRFSVQRAVFQSAHAIAFDAADKVSGQRVFLWTLKAAVKAELAEKILQNIVIPALSVDIPAPVTLSAGVAEKSKLFYTTRQMTTNTLLKRDVTERKKGIFLARLCRFLSHLHESNLVLGTLSSSSFLVSRDESIYFNGLFPLIPGVTDISKASASDLQFTAPEVQQGKSATAASDVFSLGAYLYTFLSGHDFPSHLDDHNLYQHLRLKLPAICSEDRSATWMLPILEKMLQWKPERRYTNARELFADVSEACPQLGMFGAGKLKSIDSAAASYIMSPFTKVMVAAFTVGSLGLLMSENWSTTHHSTATAGISGSLAASTSLDATPSEGVKLGSIGALNQSGITKEELSTDQGTTISAAPFGRYQVGSNANAYEGYNSPDTLGAGIGKVSSNSNAQKAEPERKAVSNRHAGLRNAYEQQVKKERKVYVKPNLHSGHRSLKGELMKEAPKKRSFKVNKDFHSPGHWVYNQNSALVEVLEKGILNVDTVTNWCPKKES